MSNVGESILDVVTEGLNIGKGEKKVIDAFLDKKKADSKKLKSDGTTLDGLWMGGSGIAKWEKGKIVMPDLGSKAADKVQKAIRKAAPKNWLAEELEEAKYDYDDTVVYNASESVASAVAGDMGLVAFDMDEKKRQKFEGQLQGDLEKAMKKVIDGAVRKLK